MLYLPRDGGLGLTRALSANCHLYASLARYVTIFGVFGHTSLGKPRQRAGPLSHVVSLLLFAPIQSVTPPETPHLFLTQNFTSRSCVTNQVHARSIFRARSIGILRSTSFARDRTDTAPFALSCMFVSVRPCGCDGEAVDGSVSDSRSVVRR